MSKMIMVMDEEATQNYYNIQNPKFTAFRQEWTSEADRILRTSTKVCRISIQTSDGIVWFTEEKGRADVDIPQK